MNTKYLNGQTYKAANCQGRHRLVVKIDQEVTMSDAVFQSRTLLVKGAAMSVADILSVMLNISEPSNM